MSLYSLDFVIFASIADLLLMDNQIFSRTYNTCYVLKLTTQTNIPM